MAVERSRERPVSRWKRRGFASAPVLASLVLLSVALEVDTPESVAWERTEVEGFAAERAPGLVLQDQVGDTVLASMGYDIYRSQAGAPFQKIHSLVPRPSEAWAAFSRSFRQRFRYEEVVEVMAVDDSSLIAFAGGDVYRIDLATGSDERVHRLRYYGRGEGRGVMPHGLARDADGSFYYGEYPTRRLDDDETVRIWRSDDQGRDWQVASEFPARSARHIHAVQWDPHGNALWVATGDDDSEARIGYSKDGGRTFTWLGSGSQTWRTCSLMFTPDAVTWAMDAPEEDSRVMRFDRRSGELVASQTILASPGYYMQSVGSRGGIMTLAEREASVWWVDGDEPRQLINWSVAANPALPHPAVRLVRSGSTSEGEDVLINPLRTTVEAAAIYRLGSALDRTPSLAQGPISPDRHF